MYKLCACYYNSYLVTGRTAETKTIGLENVGVTTDGDGFIIGNHGDAEQTSINNIFGIGDVLQVSKTSINYWFDIFLFKKLVIV